MSEKNRQWLTGILLFAFMLLGVLAVRRWQLGYRGSVATDIVVFALVSSMMFAIIIIMGKKGLLATDSGSGTSAHGDGQDLHQQGEEK